MVFSRKADKRFSTVVEPGESPELTITLDYAATVEEVSVRFYRGPEHALEVRPFKETPNGDRLPLIDMIGRDWLIGDDDYFVFDVSEDIEAGDKIGVQWRNRSDEEQYNDGDHNGFAYEAPVDIVVDQEGGASRVVSTLAEVLP